MLERVTRNTVASLGLRVGSSLENLVALRLHHWGHKPEHQYKVGRWHIDFAWPDTKIGLEVDGLHHRIPENAARDQARDASLRRDGWLVFRIDDADGTDEMVRQLARVSRVVHQVLD